MTYWWTANSSLPFPTEFALAAPDGISENTYAYVRKFVELSSREFRWGRERFPTVAELEKGLLNRWHEHLYPKLTEKVLKTRQEAALSATFPVMRNEYMDTKKVASALSPPTPNLTDETTLREVVWQMESAAGDGDGREILTARLPQILLQHVDILVDVFGGVIARYAAPESLCWWEPSPYFPLSRGGLRLIPNLLPLHIAAHRDRGDLLLAAVIREVAAADYASPLTQPLGVLPQAGGAEVSTGRFFIVTGVDGAGDGSSGNKSTSGNGNEEHHPEGTWTLRPLHSGPPAAAVVATWEYIRDTMAAGSVNGKPPGSQLGETAGLHVNEDAAEQGASVEAAALLLQDLLCTNWASLPEGVLDRSLPFQLLQLCTPDGHPTSTATADVMATVISSNAPEAMIAAPTEGAVAGLLRMYLDCVSSEGDPETVTKVSCGGSAQETEGSDALLRRARVSLAAALKWRSTGCRPVLADMLMPSAERDNPRVGGNINSNSAGAGAIAGSKMQGNDQTAEDEGAAAKTSGPVLTPDHEGKSVGIWMPNAQRLIPLSLRQPHPLQHPDDYILWPSAPQPVARWVLVDEKVPVNMETEAKAHDAEARDTRAETPDRASLGANEAETGKEPGDVVAASATITDGTSASPVSAMLQATVEYGDSDERSHLKARDGDSGGYDFHLDRVVEPNLDSDLKVSDFEFGEDTEAIGESTDLGSSVQNAELGLSPGQGQERAGGSSATSAAGLAGYDLKAAGVAIAAAVTTAQKEIGDGGIEVSATAGTGTASEARTPQQADRVRRAARRRAVLQAAAGVARRLDPTASALPYFQSVVSQQLERCSREDRWEGANEQPVVPAAADAASPQRQLFLPGLRYLPPEAAASLERAFEEAAAATAGKRSSHVVGMSVPTQDGWGPSATALKGPNDRAQVAAAIPAAAAMIKNSSLPPDSNQAPDAVGSSITALSGIEQPKLPGLKLFSAEVAGPMREAFLQAAASGRLNYHLRSTQVLTPRSPPLPLSSAEIGSGNMGKGTSPSPSSRHSAPMQPYSEHYAAILYQSEQLYVPHNPSGAATTPPAVSPTSGCFGLQRAAGALAYKNEEEEVRMEQYQNFVWITQHCRPTGRNSTGGSGISGGGRQMT